METIVDQFGGRLVAEVTITVVFVEIAQQNLGKVEGLLAATLLEGDVEFAVLAYVIDLALQFVATMQGLEDLIVVDLSLITVVDDDLEA